MTLEMISQWAHLALEWIGFGTLVGLIAKAVLPGKDDGGALATVVLGILGSVIGASLLTFFLEGSTVTPISPLGFVVALGGTTLLLVTHRMLGGKVPANVLGFWKKAKPRRHATTIVEKVS